MDLESLRFLYLRRIVGTALSAVGLNASHRLARALARGVYGLNTAGRRRAEARLSDTLAACPSDSHTSDVVAAMYDHIGRFWVEALFARRLLRETSWRRSIAMEDEKSLSRLAMERRGCLLATAYFGNPAVCAYALGEIFRPVHVVADHFAHPILRAWQSDLFAQQNIRMVDRRDAATALPRILDRKGAVLMIAEHDRQRGPSVPVSFLGRMLNCYPTLSRLSRWYDIPIAVVTCRREARPFSFALQLHETIQPPAADASDRPILQRVISALEQAILRHPEQYLWPLAGGTKAAGETEAVSREIAGLIDRGSESASCRMQSRTGSGRQTPSWAGSRPEGSAAAVEPVPTA